MFTAETQRNSKKTEGAIKQIRRGAGSRRRGRRQNRQSRQGARDRRGGWGRSRQAAAKGKGCVPANPRWDRVNRAGCAGGGREYPNGNFPRGRLFPSTARTDGAFCARRRA